MKQGLFAIAYLAITYAIYIFTRRDDEKSGFIRFLIPKSVYAHPSSIVDYKFFILNFVVSYFFAAYIFLESEPVSRQLLSILHHLFGKPATFWSETVGSIVFITITLILIADFAAFYVHYLLHKIPILWEFHKVHHSAEVLNPLTVYRMHPVDVILVGLFATFLGSIANALFLYFYGDGFSSYPGIATFIFYVTGYHLRHSHIWVSYPKILSHILISPAQHQIHHSCERHHWDKNFGYIFAFWDYMWGVLYYPESREEFRQGLTREEHKEYNTAVRLYWLPFLKASRLMRSFEKRKALGYSATVIAVTCTWFWTAKLPSNVHRHHSNTIYLEDLTWTEVDTMIDDGMTNVVVPIGCTEQAGPHLVLGKHNKIVRYTAGEIARSIGNTLVAPVVPFSPSGDIDPPNSHMTFAGTLSVPDQVLGSLLESVIQSLKVHGFQNIYLIGDDIGSQDIQKNIAEKLRTEWVEDNVNVVNLDQYYWGNMQSEWLKSRGFSEEEIGVHAGIRDTSELMFVSPEDVRADRLYQYRNFDKDGTTGNSRKASADLGKKMLQLKIDAAVNQINAVQQDN